MLMEYNKGLQKPDIVLTVDGLFPPLTGATPAADDLMFQRPFPCQTTKCHIAETS